VAEAEVEDVEEVVGVDDAQEEVDLVEEC